MRSLFRVYNKNYWVSIFGPILTFLAPLAVTILMCLVYTLSTGDGKITLSIVVIHCLIFLSSYILMVLLLPQAIFEVKASIFVKQLKASSIKMWQVLFVAIIYYAITSLIAVFISFGSARLLGVIVPDIEQEVSYSFSQINWPTFIYVIAVNILFGCSIGMLLGSVCTKSSVIALIGVLIVFLSCALAGFIAPIILSPTQHERLWYFSYIDLVRYPVTSVYEAWFSKAGPYNTNGSTLFDFSTTYSAMVADIVPYPFDVFKSYDKILNLVMPYVTICLCGGFAVRFFRV